VLAYTDDSLRISETLYGQRRLSSTFSLPNIVFYSKDVDDNIDIDWISIHIHWKQLQEYRLEVYEDQENVRTGFVHNKSMSKNTLR